MAAIQEADADCIVDLPFDLAAYVREVFGMYHVETQRMTLLCENHTMRNIIDHFEENVDTETADANYFRAFVDVAPAPPFFSWGFTFCGAIRIEGPGNVKSRHRHSKRSSKPCLKSYAAE